MSSEPKTFICASGFNKEGKGQCFPQGSKQANRIPKGKRTNCSVFPNEKCQDREEYIIKMTAILSKKLEMIEKFNDKLTNLTGEEKEIERIPEQDRRVGYKRYGEE